MRVAFFGTPEVAVPSLELLAGADDVEIVAVVTNPDRPRGRSRRPVPPPVKEAALARGLEVWQPQRARDVRDPLAERAPDVAAVVAYGSILPTDVLAVPRHGFVNLHFSMLPRWRGAAPVQQAIRAGETMTGMTTFVLDEGMDTGPVLDRRETAIGDDETAGDVLARLAVEGAPLLLASIRRLVAGAAPTPQPPEGTLAPKIGPGDVAIDWTRTAEEVRNLVRAANPAPGAHTTFRGERLKVWRADRGTGAGAPGEVVGTSPTGPVVACGDGALVLTEVQPAGKSRMDGSAFANGYAPVGERLG